MRLTVTNLREPFILLNSIDFIEFDVKPLLKEAHDLDVQKRMAFLDICSLDVQFTGDMSRPVIGVGR